MSNLTYKGSGVDYDMMDPFKILCQKVGRKTIQAFEQKFQPNFFHYPDSVGESVYLQKASFSELKDYFIGHTHEGLGTKNLVADAMYQLTGKTYYDQIAKDTVAMIVNDMITLGILPSSISMHLSAASSDWFLDEKRNLDLVNGWADACIESEAAWACGETPTLKDILLPGVVELSGSAWGHTFKNKKPFSTSNIKDGDHIVFLESSGIHANGLTLARKIADLLPEGYLTPVYDTGLNYGEMLLNPTIIYLPVIKQILDNQWSDIHYAANITGHGWRKLMRAPGNFDYVIENLPTQNPIFDFIKEKGNVTDEEMYANYNMGAGFAIFADKNSAGNIIQFANMCGFDPMYAGYVKKSDSKKVIIESKNITFSANDLKVR